MCVFSMAYNVVSPLILGLEYKIKIQAAICSTNIVVDPKLNFFLIKEPMFMDTKKVGYATFVSLACELIKDYLKVNRLKTSSMS